MVSHVGQGLKTVSSIGRDLLNEEMFIVSAKANLTNTANNILSHTVDKFVEQNGNGLKRKRIYKERSVKRGKVVKKKATKKEEEGKRKRKSVDN